MEEDWYTVEQQIRDRLTEAQAAVQIRALTQKLAPTARRPNTVGITIIRLANWVLARAMPLPLEVSRALANVSVAMKRCESAASERISPRAKRSPGFRSGRRRQADSLTGSSNVADWSP